MSKNQHGKLLGQIAVFSLNNIPPKTYNTNPQEMPWITPAPMSTPTINSTSNLSLETITSKSQNIESLILILASITIITISNKEIFGYLTQKGSSS